MISAVHTRPRTRRRWTDDEDAELRALTEAGRLLPDIARALDRTQMACSTRAESLGLRTRSTARGARAGLGGPAA